VSCGKLWVSCGKLCGKTCGKLMCGFVCIVSNVLDFL